MHPCITVPIILPTMARAPSGAAEMIQDAAQSAVHVELVEKEGDADSFDAVGAQCVGSDGCCLQWATWQDKDGASSAGTEEEDDDAAAD